MASDGQALERAGARPTALLEAAGTDRLVAIGSTVLGLAHTVRGALGLCTGSRYMMARALRKGETETIERAWRLTERSLAHVEELVRGLLEPERAGLLSFLPGDPVEEIRAFAEIAAEEALCQGIELDVALSDELRGVVFDHKVLRRCLTELTYNAFRALGASPPPRKVTLGTTSQSDCWSLVVRDTGPGISPERAGQLIENTAALAAARGSGLGLVVVRELLRLHHGSLVISGEQGQGTEIRCVFPRSLKVGSGDDVLSTLSPREHTRDQKMNQPNCEQSTERLGADEIRAKLIKLIPSAANHSVCLACGTCSSRCPASGLEGMDPRKFVHLILMGRIEEAFNSPWVWMCSLCKRCQWACPMDIDIPALVYLARSTWPREKRPKGIVGSCDKALSSDCCSAMGLPVDDWSWVVEDVLEEVRGEQPQFAEMEAPMDKEGAYFFVNENSRAPGHEPEEMVPLWKILHTVGADWTYSTKGWGGENYCMFLADDAGWEKISRIKAKAANELGCKVWLNTECGHEFYAVWAGMRRFDIERNFAIRHIVEYYAQWIREGKLKVDSAWNRDLKIKFTVQDPCQVVRKSLGNTFAEDLRFVIRNCIGDENLIDMIPKGENNYCCGGGGGYLQSGFNDARFHYGQRKYRQIVETGAQYCVTPCHNCHQQVEELCEHFGGSYHTIHLWTLICLALGQLGPNERKYLGPDLAEVGL